MKVYNWTSQNMRKLRMDYRLSQQEMADLVGVQRCTLSRWELGKNDPLHGKRGISRAINGIRRMDELAREIHFEEAT